MATTLDFINYVMDSIEDISGLEFSYKKMFGEYCVYANGKPIIIVCDNTVFVKILPCIEPLMADAMTGYPYEGAKLHFQLDIEDNRLTEKVVRLLEQNTPLPKPRRKR